MINELKKIFPTQTNFNTWDSLSICYIFMINQFIMVIVRVHFQDACVAETYCILDFVTQMILKKRGRINVFNLAIEYLENVKNRTDYH